LGRRGVVEELRWNTPERVMSFQKKRFIWQPEQMKKGGK
jgi:hypothetical protein